MKRYLLAVLITSTLIGCASAGWKENDFFINGQTVSLSPAEMTELRNAWSAPTPFAKFKTSLTPGEAQWTADFISLRESLRDRSNPCRKLTLESISPSPEDIVNLVGQHTPSSQFDEKWEITACGVKHAYRAFHPQNSTALAIEEVRPYSIATSAIANVAGSPHPLYGKWSWTYAKNNCTEVYDYRPDNTSVITSGEEQAESRFTISDKPDLNGFYRMVDVATKSNGRTGCDGQPGGTPVGDTATIYIFFKPTKDEMVMCQEPSFRACMGPLRRISQ